MAKQKKVSGRRFKKMLTVRDLIETHELYDKNRENWRFVSAVFEGIKEIIRKCLIEKHEREPQKSYDRRIKELYGFGYSKSVIEIFHFFLFKKEPEHRLSGLLDSKLWQLFYADANLYGMDYESTIMEIDLYAAIQGHMGVLIDKADVIFQTKAEQVNEKVYPYIAKYHPEAILDWKWERDEFNRPFLSYLKLEDDDEQFRLWFQDSWEIWKLPEDKDGKPDRSNMEKEAVFIKSGQNQIGKIPFIWFYNQRSKKLGIGKGDIDEVARIDLSIIKNFSQIEQIIYFAAFPMMRKPMRDAKPTSINAPQQDDEVSTEAVLEFDPEHPDSKPDWLKAEVAEPIKATLDTVEKKISEIYRAANIGGMAATEPTQNPQSGVAKRVDFQLLNSKMVSKATNLEDAENKILEFWLLWEGMWEQYKDKVKMGRSKTYDIEDLAIILEDALTAKTVVISKTFNELLQKQTARHVLPTATEKQFDAIDKEIEENVKNDQIAEGKSAMNKIDNAANRSAQDSNIINNEPRNKNQQNISNDNNPDGNVTA